MPFATEIQLINKSKQGNIHLGQSMLPVWRGLQGDAKQIVQLMMHRQPDLNKDWRGLVVTPPGTLLQQVINAYREFTDVPLELPLFACLHYVATYLSKNNVIITGQRIRRIKPFLWNVVLAPSGAGKTLSHDWIGRFAPVKTNMANCESSAKFFDELKRCKDEDGYGSWFCDEFAQKLKAIETPNGPLSEMKSICLKAFNGEAIDRATKKAGTVTIDDPTFNFYGVNTEKSFIDSISIESMADGFAQRFGYIYTCLDPDRPITNFAIYDENAVCEAITTAFDGLKKLPLHPAYSLTGEAEREYVRIFKTLFRDGAVPNSFYRRTLFKTLTYALLYHVIMEKASPDIDADDVTWASRVTELHLNDVHRIFVEKGMNDFSSKVERVKGQLDHAKAHGKPVRNSDLAKNHRFIKNAQEAQQWADWAKPETTGSAETA